MHVTIAESRMNSGSEWIFGGGGKHNNVASLRCNPLKALGHLRTYQLRPSACPSANRLSAGLSVSLSVQRRDNNNWRNCFRDLNFCVLLSLLVGTCLESIWCDLPSNWVVLSLPFPQTLYIYILLYSPGISEHRYISMCNCELGQRNAIKFGKISTAKTE